MKKIITLFILTGFLVACDKETNKPVAYTPPAPTFTATLSGNQVFTPDTIKVSSEQLVPNGPHMLRISAEKKINADSSILVQFILEDFTRDNYTQNKTVTLSTNRPAYFIEVNDKVNSTRIQYHYSQTGSLTLNKIGADYINGTFQFTYFTFDQYGAKKSEHPIQNGEFKHLKIIRK